MTKVQQIPFAQTRRKLHEFAREISESLVRWKDFLQESGQGGSVKKKRAAAAAGFGALICVTVFCYFTLGKQLLMLVEDKNAFKVWLDSFGAWSRVVFVAIRAIQTVVKIVPAEPLEIGAGYVFGAWGGLLYCSLGSLIGSVIILFLTRKFGVRIAELFIPRKKIDSLAFLQNKKNRNITLFLLYLIPSTPKDVITYIVGLTDENLAFFLLLSTVGRIPSIITSTWCGSTLESENYLMAAVIFAATALCGLLGSAVYGKLSGRKMKRA